MWWRWSALQELMSSKSSEPSLTGISSGQSPLELMGQHRPSARLNTAQHYVTQPITSQANVMSWCNCCLEVYSPGAQKWTPGWRCRTYLEHMSANHCLLTWFIKYFVDTLIIIINTDAHHEWNICATLMYIMSVQILNFHVGLIVILKHILGITLRNVHCAIKKFSK